MSVEWFSEEERAEMATPVIKRIAASHQEGRHGQGHRPL